MRVMVERSGGFAGIASRRDVDSASLDALEAATLERLAHDALTVAVPQSPPMPDAYRYDVSIDGNSRTMSETSLPSEWRSLIEWVLARADS
ncbi:MAG: hypothetical protein JWO97_4326 [Acidobacteria bacterium]|nr:hypothetical protein [Acidobacteriota bacterium]